MCTINLDTYYLAHSGSWTLAMPVTCLSPACTTWSTGTSHWDTGTSSYAVLGMTDHEADQLWWMDVDEVLCAVTGSQEAHLAFKPRDFPQQGDSYCHLLISWWCYTVISVNYCHQRRHCSLPLPGPYYRSMLALCNCKTASVYKVLQYFRQIKDLLHQA